MRSGVLTSKTRNTKYNEIHERSTNKALYRVVLIDAQAGMYTDVRLSKLV